MKIPRIAWVFGLLAIGVVNIVPFDAWYNKVIGIANVFCAGLVLGLCR